MSFQDPILFKVIISDKLPFRIIASVFKSGDPVQEELLRDIILPNGPDRDIIAAREFLSLLSKYQPKGNVTNGADLPLIPAQLTVALSSEELAPIMIKHTSLAVEIMLQEGGIKVINFAEAAEIFGNRVSAPDAQVEPQRPLTGEEIVYAAPFITSVGTLTANHLLTLHRACARFTDEIYFSPKNVWWSKTGRSPSDDPTPLFIGPSGEFISPHINDSSILRALAERGLVEHRGIATYRISCLNKIQRILDGAREEGARRVKEFSVAQPPPQP